MIHIINLYTTQGCHLCENAAVLLDQQSGFIQELLRDKTESLRVQQIEISESDDLLEAYGVRIPVLRFEGSDSELGWPFSADELRHFLIEGFADSEV